MGKRKLAEKIVEAIDDEDSNYDAIEIVEQILEEDEKTEETKSK